MELGRVFIGGGCWALLQRSGGGGRGSLRGEPRRNEEAGFGAGYRPAACFHSTTPIALRWLGGSAAAAVADPRASILLPERQVGGCCWPSSGAMAAPCAPRKSVLVRLWGRRPPFARELVELFALAAGAHRLSGGAARLAALAAWRTTPPLPSGSSTAATPCAEVFAAFGLIEAKARPSGPRGELFCHGGAGVALRRVLPSPEKSRRLFLLPHQSPRT